MNVKWRKIRYHDHLTQGRKFMCCFNHTYIYNRAWLGIVLWIRGSLQCQSLEPSVLHSYWCKNSSLNVIMTCRIITFYIGRHVRASLVLPIMWFIEYQPIWTLQYHFDYSVLSKEEDWKAERQWQNNAEIWFDSRIKRQKLILRNCFIGRIFIHIRKELDILKYWQSRP